MYYQETDLNKDFGYQYPYELDLRPTSELHQFLVSEIFRRAEYSTRVLSSRFDSWRKIDRNLTAYIPLTEEESLLKSFDPRKPVATVVPFSFIALDTIITYLSRAFLEDMFFPCEGVGPEDELGAIKLQHVLQQQAIRGKLELALHTQWRDMLAYGTGYIVPTWETKLGISADSPLAHTVETLVAADAELLEIVEEGHRFETIDPYKALPDPNVPIQKIQEMEYFGWVYTTNLMNLLRDEASGNEGLFNCKYLKGTRAPSKLFRYEDARNERDGLNQSFDSPYVNRVDVITLWVKLIPADWKLGDRETPEIWEFKLANDKVIIKANRLDIQHGMFPVVAAAPDFDGYSVAPLGRMEIIYGLQEYADWLLNTRIVNVRKSLNCMFVVDPSRINLDDLLAPTAGKIIRTTYSSWGTAAVNTAIQQLQVQDITATYIHDLMVVMELIQRASAAVDSLQGFMRPSSERRTATESRDTRMSALSRLMKTARIFSIMSMRTLGELMAEQTRQFMTRNTWVKLLGSWQEVLAAEYGDQVVMRGGKLLVTPQDINIRYDINVKDAYVGGAEYGELWMQLLQIGAQVPAVQQQLDFSRMFLHAARLLGARNIQDFINRAPSMPPIKSVQPMPDEQVQREVEKGNMIPYGQQPF